MSGLLLAAMMALGAEVALVDEDRPMLPVQARAIGQQTLIHYNARMALRDGHAKEAVKLWMLRNTLRSERQTVSAHDADFRSVTWAALGQMGICQDGLAFDDDGAGLWPLAIHNYIVSTRTRSERTKPPRPFVAFRSGRQARLVTIRDVLDADELKTVSLYYGACLRYRNMVLEAGLPVNADLSDRENAVRMLQHLLRRSKQTLGDEVRGVSAIDARLFDGYLQLTELARAAARREALEKGTAAKLGGLNRASVAEIKSDAPTYSFSRQSEPGRVLVGAVGWSVEEWMALSDERRLFLFDHARAFGTTNQEVPDYERHQRSVQRVMDQTALMIIDQLAAQERGAEVQKWIARVEDDTEAVWAGERGARLLGLSSESGFTERGVIALHRGIARLETGDVQGALGAFALAVAASPASSASDRVSGLSLRWISHIAKQFEIDEELLITLQQLMPNRAYSTLLEDLMWAAAFRGDDRSFQQGLRNQVGRGALERRIALLRPMASGDMGRFVTQIRDGLVQSPSETLRFLEQMVQRLELEDEDIRRAHLPTLSKLRKYLARLDTPDAGRHGKRAVILLVQTAALADGLGSLNLDASAADKARAIDPDRVVFAGNIRVPPTTDPPWPFVRREVKSPSIFQPLRLTPLEWEDGSGVVMGWGIDG